MAKIMQKIVVFIDVADEPPVTPLKIGNLIMNRFSIDEDASFEILKILNFNIKNYHYHYTPTKERSRKEIHFEDIVDIGVKTMADFGTDELMPHFIYCCGDYYFNYGKPTYKEQLILAKMRKYEIETAFLTTLFMSRRFLVTKELAKAKAVDDEWLKGYLDLDQFKQSINDDLESYFHKFLNQQQIEDETVHSFCLPKLTKEELKLVEEKNEEHKRTYLFDSFDVDDEIMKLSDSKDKYVFTECCRRTICLTLEPSQSSSEDESETHSETDSESDFIL